jgi:hypothetical protein
MVTRPWPASLLLAISGLLTFAAGSCGRVGYEPSDPSSDTARLSLPPGIDVGDGTDSGTPGAVGDGGSPSNPDGGFYLIEDGGIVADEPIDCGGYTCSSDRVCCGCRYCATKVTSCPDVAC